MKKNISILAVIMLSIFMTASVYAQNDSTWLDLGGIRLNKNFTQTISIKGEDLEKMPFRNLSEAIGAWLYGVYSNETTLMYVVDGNPVQDINRYSIYDIKEIIFVQSALVQLANISDQQQLVLITTRKAGEKRWGARAAASTALVKTDFKHGANTGNGTSAMNLYHQYYVGGYYHGEKIQAGVSATYLRDVFPFIKNDTVHTSIPEHFTRFQLNGFMQTSLGRANQVYLSVNAAPGTAGVDRTYVYNQVLSGNVNIHAKELLLSPYLRLHSDILPGLQNNLSGAFLNFRQSTNTSSLITNQGPQGFENGYLSTDTGKISQLIVRDNLSYTVHLGQWLMEPAVTAVYTYIKQHYGILSTNVSSQSGTGNIVSLMSTAAKGHFFSLIPQLTFYYKNILSVGGGGYTFLPPSNSQVSSSVFPFASFSFDLVKAFHPENKAGLKIFGSFAKNYNGTSGGETILYGVFTPASLSGLPGLGVYYIPVLAGMEPPLSGFSNGSSPQPHQMMMAGAAFNSRNDRFHLSYSVEKRSYVTTLGTEVPGTLNWARFIYGPADFRSYIHHLDLSGTIIKQQAFQWRSGMNVSTMSAKVNSPTPYIANSEYKLIKPLPAAYTGGWINQLSYKRFSFGMQLLYLINEYQYTGEMNNPSPFKTTNSFLLQHLYAGYTLPIANERTAEIYIITRNLLQNNESDISDRRRYYGIGFKAEL